MKNRIFESSVDVIKYKVMRESARIAWRGEDPFHNFNEIADVCAPKDEPPIRCCIYKDRAVLGERMRIALGDYYGSKDTIQVVSIACDECPKSGHTVTNLCRGCLAHNCREACPVDAIGIDSNGNAHIDKSKCVECGRCKEACKYGAIINQIRPCEKRCPVHAIGVGSDGAATIDQDKCIVCGLCVYECPFGAMNDISSIVKVVNDIRNKEEGGYKVYAIVAPAVASQYPGTTTGQVFSAIKNLGFDEVVEVAQGADLTALTEAEELLEKGFLTSSCCPAFVEYINVEFNELKDHVSSTPSPMALTGKVIKAKDKNAKVVFIGPCIAKKYECKIKPSMEYVDRVLTFLELQALLDSKDIDIKEMEEMDVNDGSCFGRGFAQSGGVTDAVKQALIELGHADFEFKPLICNGIDECRRALQKLKAGALPYNFIEGMVCEGGCVRGNGTIVNKKNTPVHMQKYMDDAKKRTMKED